MPSNKNDFLDTWNYTSEEWNLFVKEAKLLKKEDNIYMGIATLIVGIPFLMLARNTTFLTAALFVIPFAILIPWLRHRFSTSYLKPVKGEALIQFYSEYVIINNTKIDLFTSKKWIKNMKIIKHKNGLNLLEIDIAWQTRKGNTFDETRIPIPANKLERAEALIEFYKLYS